LRAKREFREEAVLSLVHSIRIEQPKIGTLKLQYLINKQSGDTGIKIGRDALYKLLKKNGLLVRHRKRKRPTMTDGNGRSIYPDLRINLKTKRSNELWSTDITYLRLPNSRFCYGTFIIDEWSHLIVGSKVSRRMTTADIIGGLSQAISSQCPSGLGFAGSLIHHSDRGSQFKSHAYLNLLKENGIRPSMTENGSAYENPVSERLNGIIKNELMGGRCFNTFKEAVDCVAKAVEIYNEKRPHLSCGMLTPKEAHMSDGPLVKLWTQRKSNSS
jgi:Transposase and inactivated derivatives